MSVVEPATAGALSVTEPDVEPNKTSLPVVKFLVPVIVSVLARPIRVSLAVGNVSVPDPAAAAAFTVVEPEVEPAKASPAPAIVLLVIR